MLNLYDEILKKLTSNLKDGVHIVDGNGKTILYNRAMEDIEGVNSTDVMGKEIQEYLKGIEGRSTIINCLRTGKDSKDIVQNYSNDKGKLVTSINSTFPVIIDDKIEAVIEISRDMTQIRMLNEALCKAEYFNRKNKSHYTFSDIVGKSPRLLNEVEKAKVASISNSPVLIYGETGCGKELFAQSIHYDGIRRYKPFIAINCAAIPSALLEGMLFGIVKGSFTGAENKRGIFEEAHRGTILLDEINAMDTYMQSKLLRVLQDGCIRPVGGNKTIDVDVRIIATTNEDPIELIKQGKLRKDFYYRLSVIRLNIPPLRERKDDIENFCTYFIKYYNEILFKNVKSIDREVYKCFLKYDWPGNIRELKNTIESAMNMIESSDTLSMDCFINKTSFVDDSGVVDEYKLSDGLDDMVYKYEYELIKRSYEKNKKNMTKTARELKISRQKLQYKIKKYSL